MITYLRKAIKTPETESSNAQSVASQMLSDIEARGEAAVREYALKLDQWSGAIVVTPEMADARTRGIPQQVKRDIEFAAAQVKRFAEAQKASCVEFAQEISPGLTAGQRLIPCNVAGCYVPTGRYAHIASAYMSVATAKPAPYSNPAISCGISAPCAKPWNTAKNPHSPIAKLTEAFQRSATAAERTTIEATIPVSTNGNTKPLKAKPAPTTIMTTKLSGTR